MEFLDRNSINKLQSNKKIVSKSANRNLEGAKIIQESGEIDTKDIVLLSTNADFYKTFLFNGENISVYINVRNPEAYYLVLTTCKNCYYIKICALDKINNLGCFKEMVLENLSNSVNIRSGDIPELTKNLIDYFIRDTNQDIIYNVQNPDSKIKNYPLFYFVDCRDNIFLAFNKKNVDSNIVSKYKYKEEEGCLLFLCNSDTSRNVNINDTNEVDMFIDLGHKTFYAHDNLITCF